MCVSKTAVNRLVHGNAHDSNVQSAGSAATRLTSSTTEDRTSAGKAEVPYGHGDKHVYAKSSEVRAFPKPTKEFLTPE